VVPTASLAKVRLAGETLAAAPAPVPVRLTFQELWKESVTVTAAVRAPEALGLNVTLMAQLAPAATLDPQLLVSVKSVALLPVTATLLMLRVALPELVMVTV
jgi:hypothetical protein